VIVPLLGAAFRAPLGTADCSIHLAGPTGAGKSELAALAQQHFGAGLDARHLPGSWASTGNALEGQAFTLKDSLMVVDDFAPVGGAGDVARLHREADRLLRAQGNHAGRQRMRADATLRPAKPPRGLILSTGEDLPRGQSLRARLMVAELGPGELNWAQLTERQRDAAEGMYAQALAGYVRWLAPNYATVRDSLRTEAAKLRDRARVNGQHARTPGIVADLATGWRCWLDFAMAVGAIDQAQRDRLMDRIWTALQEAGADQAEHQTAAEPCAHFLRLLSAVLASGRAHMAAKDGGQPPDADAWGWRATPTITRDGSAMRWEPQGRCIGWLDGADIYLEPDAAYAEAQALAGQQGESLPVTPRTLWRRLREHRPPLLASWDEARQRNTVRRTLAGQRHCDVLHLRADALSTTHTEPSTPSTQHAAPHQESSASVDGSAGVDGSQDCHHPPNGMAGATKSRAVDGVDGCADVEHPSAARDSTQPQPRRRRGVL
jgi:hypothetical protein